MSVPLVSRQLFPPEDPVSQSGTAATAETEAHQQGRAEDRPQHWNID